MSPQTAGWQSTMRAFLVAFIEHSEVRQMQKDREVSIEGYMDMSLDEIQAEFRAGRGFEPQQNSIVFPQLRG
jgi:hypothetical protein